MQIRFMIAAASALFATQCSFQNGAVQLNDGKEISGRIDYVACGITPKEARPALPLKRGRFSSEETIAMDQVKTFTVGEDVYETHNIAPNAVMLTGASGLLPLRRVISGKASLYEFCAKNAASTFTVVDQFIRVEPDTSPRPVPYGAKDARAFFIKHFAACKELVADIKALADSAFDMPLAHTFVERFNACEQKQ